MNRTHAMLTAIAASIVLIAANLAFTADWPQWRGPNRDAKVTGFKAPATWPAQLSQQWKVPVGNGDATPSLVGNKLYVFTMQDGNEVIRCLDAGTGNELWQDKYPAQGATGPASGHAGPRASPTVAEGKVVTFGVRGMLSCLDATSGKVLWRKNDFEGDWPGFFTSSSPIVVDGLCIAQLGGRNGGGIVAYDLTTGDERWKWPGDSPAYASPVLLTLDGAKLVVALTAGKLVALTAGDGKLAWETAASAGGGGGGRGGFGGPGRGGPGGERGRGGPGRGEGGRGEAGREGAPRDGGDRPGERKDPAGDQGKEKTAADSGNPAAEQRGDQFAQRSGGNEQAQQPGQRGGERGERGRGGPGGQGGRGRGGMGGGGRSYNASTPVVDGQTIIYSNPTGGIKAVKLEKDGDKVVAKDLWTNPEATVNFNSPVVKGDLLFGLTQANRFFCINAQTGKTAWIGPGGQTGGGGFGGRGGYGSIVDAGSVLLAITPGSELVVIEPSEKEYKELARIKAADSPTYAHLVVADNRLFVKDQDNVTLWKVE